MEYKKVLIVDDESELRTLTKEVLELSNFSTIEAEDGMKAYRLLLEYHDVIDLVLLDMRLPGMDGESLIQKINQLQNNPKIIIISACKNYFSNNYLLNNNIYKYLIKPFGLKVLMDAVCEAMFE